MKILKFAFALFFLTSFTLWQGQNDGTPQALIVFMAPECPICRYYTPLLKSLKATTLQRQGFLVLAFTTGDSSSVAQFERVYQTGWRLLWGKQAKELANLYQASVTPELVVLNVNNELLYRGRVNEAFVSPGRRRPIIRVSEIDSFSKAIQENKEIKMPFQPAIGCLMNP